MADQNFTVNVSTNSAVQSVDKLISALNNLNKTLEGLKPANLEKVGNSAEKVGTSFGKMKVALAGLAAGTIAYGRMALAFADELVDLSKASDIAVSNLLELKEALTVSGGDPTMMAAAVNNFLRSIDEAAQGSNKAISSFEKLNVSISQLETLSEFDLMKETLKGIAALPSATERAAAMMDKFGKSFKTVNPKDLLDALQQGKGQFDDYSKSIQRAAELNDQLATASANVKIAFLETFGGIIGYLAEFNSATAEGKEKIESLMAVMKALAVTAAFVFGFTMVGGIVRLIGSIGRGIGALGSFIPKFTEVGASITRIFGANSNVMKVLRGVGGLIAGILASLATIVGLKGPEGKGGDAGATESQAKAQTEAAAAEEKRRKVELHNRTVALNQIKDISKEYEKQQNLTLSRLNLETSLIGKTENEKQMAEAQAKLAEDYSRIQEDLLKKKRDLGEEDSYQIATIDAMIKKNAELYTQQSAALTEAINKNQAAKLIEEDRQRNLENMVKAIEDQAERMSLMGDIIRSARDKMADVRFEGAQQGRTPLERQFASIQENARKAGLEAQRAFADSFKGMEMTNELSQELADGLSRIATEYQKIAEEQSKNLESSRTWASGWKDAFNEYMDNATNAARQAGEVFSGITRNMESAIDKFVETGKFSFKDFARSIIQDMLKIELKAAASKILSGIFGGGGGSFLGSLFGFADGGTPPVNKPSIVGERGPELFIPKTPGTIVPNEMLGGNNVNAPVTNNYYTYNIDAIDSRSVAQFFAENRRTMLGTIQLAQKELPYFNK